MKRVKGIRGNRKRIDKNSLLLVNQERAEDSPNSHAKESAAASNMTEDTVAEPLF